MREYKCERCNAAPEKHGYDDNIDQEQAAALRIAEVQTNFGIVWAMCINCRREWMKWLNTNKAMHEYSEYRFRLEHWRIAHRKTGKEDIEKGLEFVRKLNSLDTELYAQATSWFESGQRRLSRLKARHDDEFHTDEFGNG